MKHFVVFLILATGSAAAADDKCVAPANAVRKVIQLQYLQAYPVAELAKGLGLCVAADGNARLVAVSGPANAVQALEETLKKIDVARPNKQVELIGYILLADGEGSGAAAPAALTPVIDQLRQVFPFKGYQVLDTMIARMGGNRNTDLSGQLPGIKPAGAASDMTRTPQIAAQMPNYRFAASLRDVSSGQVVFDQLDLMLYEGPGQQLRIQTSTSIRDGQTVVIGKANSSHGGQAYFLVLSVKLVD